MDDDIKGVGGSDDTESGSDSGEEFELYLDIDLDEMDEQLHKEEQGYLMTVCERELGVTFMNWQTFVRFCRTGPEGKEYFKTLKAKHQEDIISAKAFIERKRG